MSEGHHVRRRQRPQPAADQRVLPGQLAELLPPGCGGPAVRAAAAARKRARVPHLESQRCSLARAANADFCLPQLNIMSFISELLQWFEMKKPDFVKPVEAVDLAGLWRLDQPAWFRWCCPLLTSFSASLRCLGVAGLHESHQREWQQV